MTIVKKVKGNPAALNGNRPKKTSSPEEGLSLPSKVNSPPTVFTENSIFIYGDKGIGKSSLLAQYLDSIHLVAEHKRRGLRIRMIPEGNEQPLNWKRMQGYARLIAKAKDIKTVVFDTVDRCYDLCFKDVCSRHGCKHPKELSGWDGAELWHIMKMEFEDLIKLLQDAAKVPAFISHSRSREVEIDGVKWQETYPTCSPAPWGILKAITEYAFCYGFQKGQRTFWVRPSNYVWAGCASEEHFLDPDKKQLLSFSAGNSAQQAFKSLLDAYANKRTGELYEEYDTSEEEEETVSLPRKIKRK